MAKKNSKSTTQSQPAAVTTPTVPTVATPVPAVTDAQPAAPAPTYRIAKTDYVAPRASPRSCSRKSRSNPARRPRSSNVCSRAASTSAWRRRRRRSGR